MIPFEYERVDDVAGAVAVAEPLGVCDEVAETILARYAVGAVDLVPLEAMFA